MGSKIQIEKVQYQTVNSTETVKEGIKDSSGQFKDYISEELVDSGETVKCVISPGWYLQDPGTDTDPKYEGLMFSLTGTNGDTVTSCDYSEGWAGTDGTWYPTYNGNLFFTERTTNGYPKIIDREITSIFTPYVNEKRQIEYIGKNSKGIDVTATSTDSPADIGSSYIISPPTDEDKTDQVPIDSYYDKSTWTQYTFEYWESSDGKNYYNWSGDVINPVPISSTTSRTDILSFTAYYSSDVFNLNTYSEYINSADEWGEINPIFDFTARDSYIFTAPNEPSIFSLSTYESALLVFPTNGSRKYGPWDVSGGLIPPEGFHFYSGKGPKTLYVYIPSEVLRQCGGSEIEPKNGLILYSNNPDQWQIQLISGDASAFESAKGAYALQSDAGRTTINMLTCTAEEISAQLNGDFYILMGYDGDGLINEGQLVIEAIS